jgi:hypothetical protein
LDVGAATVTTPTRLKMLQQGGYFALCINSRFDFRIGGALMTCLRSFSEPSIYFGKAS